MGEEGLVAPSSDSSKTFIDGYFFYHFTTGVKRKKKSALLSNEVPNTVKGIALMMAAPDSGLNIKPRTGFFDVYPDCFVASQAVDWMLQRLALRSRQEAVDLGRKLVDSGYIQHVKEPQAFEDKKTWFRFTRYAELKMSSDSIHEEVVETEEPICTPADFEQIETIGERGYGKVKLVTKKSNGRIYAMKIIDKSKVKTESCIEHINTEKKVLVNNNPFLLHLYYSFQTATKLYFVTDFLPGGDLFHHLSRRKGRGFHPQVVRFFTAELVLALEHLHQCGVIYRDLKLENVLLDELGHICLADFGLSKFLLGDEEKAHTICGSKGYLAPEIIRGEPYSFEVDWFSLGVMIYGLISTNNPFLSLTFHETCQAILTRTVQYPKDYFSSDLADFVNMMLQRDPKKRFQTASQIKRHPWFKGVRWEKLAVKKVVPPFHFAVANEGSVEHFDQVYTRMEITSEDDEVSLNSDNSEIFGNFDYVAELPTQ